ncbi:ketopantoate reductase PanE/ApbA C terminal-domain-containing protein [Penicillium pulvis]|uniref:ketopantoate reductase PanE/ApbA C terminal-domain-containing protein n=1 Tax=Penicillium pulvis TaxID=1562058 RepID=UPI002548E235|nr:ketopantoate reductase PanE/ApbA C terminal-domain-containing protein [Penicillium pulvis]KAJ5786797.1 ketopantoate reductase PanE/ApbA C terminal-domain-containing protein [Penicillium pulvis]
MAKTRILVVGTGGIGTMAAYALEQGGLAEVTAVMRSNHDAAVANGIDIDSVQWGQIKAWKPSFITRTVPDVSKGEAEPFDYILVTTKNIPDVPPTVADIISPAVTPGQTAIVLSQNGINIEKPLMARFPKNPLISSVAYTGATETALAKIYNDDPDCQKIGAFVNPEVPIEVAEEAAKFYVDIYNPHGKLDVIYEPDVPKVRWRKIAYNGSMNPIASILQMDTPRMRMSQHIIDDLILPMMMEIQAIAAADGVILQSDLVDAVMHQDPNDTAFKPSMCQDYEKGNLMEIENLVGEPLREAERLNVPAPTLKIIYGIMKGLQLKTKEAKGLWEPKFHPRNPYT